jgi:formate hydrogenlyase subunit 3/multisubunit Na+/H+ antiporter MnhD subunit
MPPWSLGLLPLVWAWPAALALLWIVPGLRPSGERLVPWAALPAFLVALLALFVDVDAAAVRLPLIFSGLHFALDGVARTFLFFTALLWLACGLHARSYHAHDPQRRTLLLFFTLTMTGNLGLILAADALTFYLFFALMTFSAYGLVVHRRDARAQRAGRV